MKSHARVVVVGGGVVGVSTLYHLAKKGWSDVVLLERTELTAGSTWHAAGLLPLFNMSYAVGQLHKYSVDLYKTLEEETGQEVGFHVTGNLRLATRRDRMDEYRKYCGTANTIGVPFEIISPAEVKELWPLCEVDDLVGALYHPDDGHIAPVDVTNAMARGARQRGAEIHRQTEVTGVEWRASSQEWVLSTSQGEISCEHVVCATGNYARQIGRMFGLSVPAIPVQHQYIVTDVVPELKAYREAGGKELAVLRDSDSSFYLREERQGYILGPYEKGAPAVFAQGVPPTFGQDLFDGDIERLMPHVEAAIRRVPSFEHAGIKQIVNGPISYTPDGSPLVGPAWNKRNLWLNEGHSFGVTAAGGSGWQLAEWIVEGEPGIDMLALDPRRLGGYTSTPYLVKKNEETYANVFTVHYPDEERPAARPSKTSPAHDQLEALGAVWGQRYGWERPNWFAPAGVERRDVWSFRRSNYFEHVGNECRAVRDRVGLIDLTPFTRHEISGPGAEAWLNGLCANRMPLKVGRSTLCHALTTKGGVRSEFTVSKMAEERFFVVSSGAAERYDSSYLHEHLPADGGVRLANITTQRGTYVVVGPQSRRLLEQLVDVKLDNASFPWLSAQTLDVGLAADVYALRVNFVGDLGWELHFPIEYGRSLFHSLIEAGEAIGGLAMVGMRAMDSLRIEKSYRMWGQELTFDYSPLTAGLDRMVRLDKDYIGRAAIDREKAEGSKQKFVTMEVKDIEDVDSSMNDPIWRGSELVGRVTSGAYGHWLGKSLALGYIDAPLAEVGQELSIEILGGRKPAVIIEESPYDPNNESLRCDA